MGIIELRMDGTGFTFIAEAVMVFLVAAIQHVDGGKLSFKTKFRHRFTAEIIFFTSNLSTLMATTQSAPLALAMASRPSLVKRLSCWDKGRFSYGIGINKVVFRILEEFRNFRTVGNGFETCVVFHIFTDDERHDGKLHRSVGAAHAGKDEKSSEKRGSSHFKEFIHL